MFGHAARYLEALLSSPSGSQVRTEPDWSSRQGARLESVARRKQKCRTPRSWTQPGQQPWLFLPIAVRQHLQRIALRAYELPRCLETVGRYFGRWHVRTRSGRDSLVWVLHGRFGWKSTSVAGIPECCLRISE